MVGRANVIALGVLMPIVDGFILTLRIVARRNRQAFNKDDVLAIIAYIFMLPICIILIYGTVKLGYGQHSDGSTAGYTNQLPITTETKHLSAIAQFIFPLSIGPSKLSMLFFYRRIFKGRTFNITSWILIFCASGWMCAMFFTAVFQCGTHVNYLWGSAMKIATKCLEGEPIALAMASLDFVTDLAILILPIYWTTKLQMHKTRKILVITVFAIGALAVIASLARLIVFFLLFPGHNQHPDQLGYITDIPYYEALEMGLAIIAICLPSLSGFLSDRERLRLMRWLNTVVPSRFYTLRNIATAETAAANGSTKARSNMQTDGSHKKARVRNYDALLRVESDVGVETEVSSNSTDMTHFKKEGSIQIVTRTTQERQDKE